MIEKLKKTQTAINSFYQFRQNLPIPFVYEGKAWSIDPMPKTPNIDEILDKLHFLQKHTANIQEKRNRFEKPYVYSKTPLEELLFNLQNLPYNLSQSLEQVLRVQANLMIDDKVSPIVKLFMLDELDATGRLFISRPLLETLIDELTNIWQKQSDFFNKLSNVWLNLPTQMPHFHPLDKCTVYALDDFDEKINVLNVDVIARKPTQAQENPINLYSQTLNEYQITKALANQEVLLEKIEPHRQNALLFIARQNNRETQVNISDIPDLATLAEQAGGKWVNPLIMVQVDSQQDKSTLIVMGYGEIPAFNPRKLVQHNYTLMPPMPLANENSWETLKNVVAEYENQTITSKKFIGQACIKNFFGKPLVV